MFERGKWKNTQKLVNRTQKRRIIHKKIFFKSLRLKIYFYEKYNKKTQKLTKKVIYTQKNFFFICFFFVLNFR